MAESIADKFDSISKKLATVVTETTGVAVNANDFTLSQPPYKSEYYRVPTIHIEMSENVPFEAWFALQDSLDTDARLWSKLPYFSSEPDTQSNILMVSHKRVTFGGSLPSPAQQHQQPQGRRESALAVELDERIGDERFRTAVQERVEEIREHRELGKTVVQEANRVFEGEQEVEEGAVVIFPDNGVYVDPRKTPPKIRNAIKGACRYGHLEKGRYWFDGQEVSYSDIESYMHDEDIGEDELEGDSRVRVESALELEWAVRENILSDKLYDALVAQEILALFGDTTGIFIHPAENTRDGIEILPSSTPSTECYTDVLFPVLRDQLADVLDIERVVRNDDVPGNPNTTVITVTGEGDVARTLRTAVNTDSFREAFQLRHTGALLDRLLFLPEGTVTVEGTEPVQLALDAQLPNVDRIRAELLRALQATDPEYGMLNPGEVGFTATAGNADGVIHIDSLEALHGKFADKEFRHRIQLANRQVMSNILATVIEPLTGDEIRIAAPDKGSHKSIGIVRDVLTEGEVHELSGYQEPPETVIEIDEIVSIEETILLGEGISDVTRRALITVLHTNGFTVTPHPDHNNELHISSEHQTSERLHHLIVTNGQQFRLQLEHQLRRFGRDSGREGGI